MLEGLDCPLRLAYDPGCLGITQTFDELEDYHLLLFVGQAQEGPLQPLVGELYLHKILGPIIGR